MKKSDMYRLISNPPRDGVTPTPFWGYSIETPGGECVGSFTRVEVTIDTEHPYPRMTFFRKWVDMKDNTIKEEKVENVPVEIVERRWDDGND